MQAIVRSTTGKTQSTDFSVRTLSQQEKRKRALKALGLCWLAMVVTAPLPPIHWVTVPGCFIAGIVMFIRRISEKEHSEPFTFPCPECGQPVAVDDRPFTPEWEQVCPNCKFSLQISAQGQAPAAP